jgi:uncharacterized membrane protein
VSDRWGTGRLEAFIDGIFAIAITLLVLEIGVPESDFENLWKGIADQWPSYLGYATSFLTIGALWGIHHGIFRRLARADAMVMRINLLLLMLVSFLPFPTKLVAEAIDLTSAEGAAVIFYGLVLLSISVVPRPRPGPGPGPGSGRRPDPTAQGPRRPQATGHPHRRGVRSAEGEDPRKLTAR